MLASALFSVSVLDMLKRIDSDLEYARPGGISLEHWNARANRMCELDATFFATSMLS
jgi:hypothetical protein